MSKRIILKKNPKVEFRLHGSGFQIIDEQTSRNSGFFAYRDLQSIELKKLWFPALAKWLRVLTWILNGVPFFPDAETCKKATMTIRFDETTLGLWLTDSHMTAQARLLKNLLDRKI